MPQPADIIQFLRQSALMVWRAAESGSVEDLPEWSTLTGQSHEELAGDGWMDVIHPDDVERVRMAWRTAVLHGSEYNTDYRVKYADGVYRWVNSRGIPILNADGAVNYWVGAVFSVTGMLRSSAKLQHKAAGPTQRKRFTDITPAALRAARGALSMSAAVMAKEAGLSLSTVRRLEERDRDTASFRQGSVERILITLQRHRLVFLGDGNIVTGIDASSVDE